MPAVGQGIASQSRVSVSAPSQFVCSQTRVRNSLPCPQDTEQAVHTDQSLQPPDGAWVIGEELVSEKPYTLKVLSYYKEIKQISSKPMVCISTS